MKSKIINIKANFSLLLNQTKQVWGLCCLLSTPSIGYAQEESNLYDETGNQKTFYVAPIGNDDNDGSFEAPFKTLFKAQKAVREINSNMTGDVVVCLRSGTYQLSNTLSFNNLDGGKFGHYV